MDTYQLLTYKVGNSVRYTIIVERNINNHAALECVEGDVRLVGGSHYREGTVEVCRRQQWGRVCDDEWGVEDSAVVCRQLGLASEGQFNHDS